MSSPILQFKSINSSALSFLYTADLSLGLTIPSNTGHSLTQHRLDYYASSRLSAGTRPFPALVNVRHCSLSCFWLSFGPSCGYFPHMSVLICALLNPPRRPSAKLRDFFFLCSVLFPDPDDDGLGERTWKTRREWICKTVRKKNKKKGLQSGGLEQDWSVEWAAQECGPRPVLASRQKHRHEAFPNTSTDIEHFHNSLTKPIGAWVSYVFISPRYCIL